MSTITKRSRSVLFLGLALVTFGLLVSQAQRTGAQESTTQESGTEPASQPAMSDSDRVSYALGVLVGGNLKREFDRFEAAGDPLNMGVVTRAIRDVVSDKTLAMDQQACQEAYQTASQGLTEKLSAANRKLGEEYIAKKRLEDGVKATESGLLYEILVEGDGEVPKPTDRVKVHYRGTLIDGTEFDSSYGRGQPATFGVTQVIRGWTEALQLMKVGSKYRLYIPSDLAYGERQAGQLITPGSTLTFEVELLEIVK